MKFFCPLASRKPETGKSQMWLSNGDSGLKASFR
jgi:hypothetical protein